MYVEEKKCSSLQSNLFLAIPTSDVIKNDQVRQELHDVHVPLRRQVRRRQPHPGVRLHSAEPLRDGRRATLLARVAESVRHH